MADTDLIPARCRFLTTKNLFVDTGKDPWDSLSAQYWCGLTQTCLGPDGQLCDDRQCLPERGCFDAV